MRQPEPDPPREEHARCGFAPEIAEPACFQSLATSYDSPSVLGDIVEGRVLDAPELQRTSLHRRRAGPSNDGVQAGLLICRSGFGVERSTGESTEWKTPTAVVRLDSARAYGSVRHGAIAPRMGRIQISASIVVAVLRDIRSSTLIFGQKGWHTAALSPTIGMEDVFSEVRGERLRRECGVLLGRRRLLYIWADDMWILATSAEALIDKMQTLEEATARMAGPELRWLNNQWTGIQRQEPYVEELRPFPQCANLLEMQETPAGSCIKVLRAYVQPDGGHHLEFREVGRVARVALHASKAQRNAPGRCLRNL